MEENVFFICYLSMNIIDRIYDIEASVIKTRCNYALIIVKMKLSSIIINRSLIMIFTRQQKVNATHKTLFAPLETSLADSTIAHTFLDLK